MELTLPIEILLQIFNIDPNLELINNLCLSSSLLKDIVTNNIDNVKSNKISSVLSIIRLNGLRVANVIIEIKDINSLLMLTNMPKLKIGLFDLSKYYQSMSNDTKFKRLNHLDFYYNTFTTFINQYTNGYYKDDGRIIKNNRSLNKALFYFIDTRSYIKIYGVGSNSLIIKTPNLGYYEDTYQQVEPLITKISKLVSVDVYNLYTSWKNLKNLYLPNINTLVLDLRTNYNGYFKFNTNYFQTLKHFYILVTLDKRTTFEISFNSLINIVPDNNFVLESIHAPIPCNKIIDVINLYPMLQLIGLSTLDEDDNKVLMTVSYILLNSNVKILELYTTVDCLTHYQQLFVNTDNVKVIPYDFIFSFNYRFPYLNEVLDYVKT